mgnify:CR=1 FL=1
MPLAPIGCAVQFHVKPGHQCTWGEHSTDGWYIGASPEHYRTHRIFVKATPSHCLLDTVFFKHKYITQPTVTPADAIVKAFHDLMATLKGTTNLKGQQNMDAITQLQRTLSPTVTPQPQAPRVNFQDTVQLRTFDPNGVTPLEQLAPTQVIVESPITSPDIERPRLSIPSIPAKSAVDNTSIASRIALRRRTTTPTPNDSIAAHLLARRRDCAHTVINMETGQALEYRQLLRHPKFKEAWSTSAANEFGRLAQGVGGRVKGTNN